MSTSNTITASVEFYFRGNKIVASIQLDLDQHMQAAGKLPALFPLLARAANLDPYSYEYEMMQAEIIHYSHAQGLVEKFVFDNVLDIPAFEQAWQENRVIETMQQIAKQYLDIDDLNQQADIKKALLAAYHCGAETAI